MVHKEGSYKSQVHSIKCLCKKMWALFYESLNNTLKSLKLRNIIPKEQMWRNKLF